MIAFSQESFFEIIVRYVRKVLLTPSISRANVPQAYPIPPHSPQPAERSEARSPFIHSSRHFEIVVAIGRTFDILPSSFSCLSATVDSVRWALSVRLHRCTFSQLGNSPNERPTPPDSRLIYERLAFPRGASSRPRRGS
ncbi:unnamed protein product, partial [Iphiclides podalirius]